MLAVYALEPNPTDPVSSVIVGERPLPQVPEGWVRVKMSAASLNSHDLSTLRGKKGLQGDRVFPMVLGCDGAGRLDDGTEVAIYPIIGNPNWNGPITRDPERRTFGEADQGTFAEYAVVPKRNAIQLPKGLSLSSAAVLGAAWLTAYRMLFTKSGLRPGQTMFVQGASGGVSTALIQLGRAAGMRVWVAGRSEEKLALAMRLGAHRTFASGEVLPERVDAVLDSVGAATWSHSMHSVRPGGTLVVCSAITGSQPGADLSYMLRDEISVRGVFAGSIEEMNDLMAFVVAASIEPQVGHVLPMDKAKEAFSRLLEGRGLGKILLTL